MCQILVEVGANILCENSFGLGVLHVSAQGDQPSVLFLFHKIFNMPITKRDNSGSTPLHWACFSCSELALIYILAWITPSDLQIQDINGYTALHLSVGSSDQLKNCRPTRALLYRGADKELKSKKGKKAIDLAQEVSSPSIKNELVGYLQQGRSFCDCLMLKTPLKKTERSNTIPFFFLALNLIAYAILSIFIFPVYEFNVLIYVSAGIEILMLVFWFASCCMNPGFIKKPDSVDFLQLMQMIDPVQLCPDCEIVRTPRSRHCGTCNMCVERFDHHCPWINNCVGTRNHGVFITFLTLMGSSIIFNFAMTLQNMYFVYESDSNTSLHLNYSILPDNLH